MTENNKFWHSLVLAIAVMLLAIFGVWIIQSHVVPSSVPLTDANLTIVLSFIGVLATFIVIGNFAQVSDIRRSMEQDLEKKKIEIDKLQTRINKISGTAGDLSFSLIDLHNEFKKFGGDYEKQIEDLVETIKTDGEYKESYINDKIHEMAKTIYKYKMLAIDAIIMKIGNIEKIKNLLQKINEATSDTSFIISYKGTSDKTAKKINDATCKIENLQIFFYQGEEPIATSTIKEIDGCKLNILELTAIYKLYCDAYSQKKQTEFSDNDITYEDSSDDEGFTLQETENDKNKREEK